MGSGSKAGITTGVSSSQMMFEQFESEQKARENENRVFEELSEVQQYVETNELRNHIEQVIPSESHKGGIKGAHNKENFLHEIDRAGAHITSTTPNSQIDGVEKITYQMPKRDKAGKLTSEYQSKTHNKTVYDPAKISTDQYIKWGLEAANKASAQSPSGKLGHEWTGVDSNGVKWHGYCDDNGNITSFYPED